MLIRIVAIGLLQLNIDASKLTIYSTVYSSIALLCDDLPLGMRN